MVQKTNTAKPHHVTPHSSLFSSQSLHAISHHDNHNQQFQHPSTTTQHQTQSKHHSKALSSFIIIIIIITITITIIIIIIIISIIIIIIIIVIVIVIVIKLWPISESVLGGRSKRPDFQAANFFKNYIIIIIACIYICLESIHSSFQKRTHQNYCL